MRCATKNGTTQNWIESNNLRVWIRINKASSDAGPELAGRESHCGDGKPVGPDCPLEKGVRGIETGHQMPGRSWRAG